jgi:GNAT superfamily N-acetyltransferase
VTSISGITPLATDVVPRPFASPPAQTVVAVLSLAIFHLVPMKVFRRLQPAVSLSASPANAPAVTPHADRAADIPRGLTIRPATTDDLGAILPLMRGYCDFYEANPTDAGLEEMARTLIELPDEEGFLLCACAADGRVVGLAACGWKWSSLRGARIVVLEDLFVETGSRGQGHADALIEASAEWARRLGAPAMTWLTAPDNRRAQAVYERVGAVAEPFLEYELGLAAGDNA